MKFDEAKRRASIKAVYSQTDIFILGNSSGFELASKNEISNFTPDYRIIRRYDSDGGCKVFIT